MLSFVVRCIFVTLSLNFKALASTPQEQALRIHSSSNEAARRYASQAKRMLREVNKPSQSSEEAASRLLHRLDKPSVEQAESLMAHLKNPTEEEKARAHTIIKSTEGDEKCITCGENHSHLSSGEKPFMQLEEKAPIPKNSSSDSSSSRPKTPSSLEVLVFVSFGLADEVLKGLNEECLRVGARLVMRGLLQDSFTKTKNRLDQLGISIDIDPPLFEDYSIKQVPTFILTDHQKVDRLSGTVNLKYALEQMNEKGEVGGVAPLLDALRGTSW